MLRIKIWYATENQRKCPFRSIDKDLIDLWLYNVAQISFEPLSKF